jgi:hypothetical protein
MPLSATIEDIKAYQEKVEKDKILPCDLASCSRCDLDSQFFKFHAYRDRRFLIIVKMIVTAVFCPLLRFRCPDCGKTYTWYPDFAVPHKHYTRQTIENFTKTYIEDNPTTYEKTVMVEGSVPGYSNNNQVLAGSTIHRWITTLANILFTFKMPINVRSSWTDISSKKYRTPKRKAELQKCRSFFHTKYFLKSYISPSLQLNTS